MSILNKLLGSEKKNNKVVGSGEGLTGQDMAALNHAMDTVGSFLSSFGHYSFDTEKASAAEIKALCEKWELHLLTGTASPGTRINNQEPEKAADRNWQGARKFFLSHRRNEAEYITSALDQFRQFVFTFIRQVSKTILEDQDEENRVISQIERLQKACKGNNIELIKQEVISAASMIAKTVEERKKRQHQQIEELGAKLKTMRSELEEAQKTMALDSMTKLFKRSAFDEHLLRTVDLSFFSGQPALLMLIDVDHFKTINDKFGHPAGDQVLLAIANCCVRSFPRKNDFIARYGGDEFVVIFQDTAVDAGIMLGNRLLEAVRNIELENDDLKSHISVSIGVSEMMPKDTPVSWLERTDKALYKAKEMGRNRVVVK